MRRVFLFGLLLFGLLHNDVWLWHDARPVLGLPVGLAYHVAYCLAAAVLMALLLVIDPLPDDDEGGS